MKLPPRAELHKKQSLKDRIQIYLKRNETSQGQALVFLVLVFCLTIGGFFYRAFSNQANPESQFHVQANAETPSISFVGDISLSRYIAEIGERDGYEAFFTYVKPHFDGRDLVFANLESAVTYDNRTYVKPASNMNNASYFDSSIDSVKAMQEAGIGLVSMANNHTGDMGKQGMVDGMEILRDVGMDYIGMGHDQAEASQAYQFVANDLTTSIFAVSDVIKPGQAASNDEPGVLTTNSQAFLNLANSYDQESDLVIAYIHAGIEYIRQPDANHQELAESLIDAGADIVISSHTHSLLPVEKYQNGIIFYGLGNFIFDQGMQSSTDSVILDMDINSPDQVRFTLRPMKIEAGIPKPNPNGLITQRIQRRLTERLDDQDFRIDRADNIVIDFDLAKDGGNS